MGTITFKTPETASQEALAAFRESTVVSAFQARAALDQAGYTPDIETHMAAPTTDPFTKLAWEKATEFRRNSPTVKELAVVLGITDAQLDDLFRYAITVYA